MRCARPRAKHLAVQHSGILRHQSPLALCTSTRAAECCALRRTHLTSCRSLYRVVIRTKCIELRHRRKTCSAINSLVRYFVTKVFLRWSIQNGYSKGIFLRLSIQNSYLKFTHKLNTTEVDHTFLVCSALFCLYCWIAMELYFGKSAGPVLSNCWPRHHSQEGNFFAQTHVFILNIK